MPIFFKSNDTNLEISEWFKDKYLREFCLDA